MEGFFSEWFEFHKCVLAGDCSIFDMPDAICYIDVVIFIIVGSCGFALKRWIKVVGKVFRTLNILDEHSRECLELLGAEPRQQFPADKRGDRYAHHNNSDGCDLP